MKNFGRLVVILVAALSIAVFTVAMLGVESRYGDISTVIVNGSKQLSYGADFENTAKMTLGASDDESKLTDAELIRAKSVVEKRMSQLIAADYSVSCDFENKRLVVYMAYPEDSAFSPNSVGTMLCTEGSLKIYKGSEADEDKLVLTDADVMDAASYSESLGGYFSYYGMNITFNAEGRKKLREVTEELVKLKAETDESQSLSVWLDGENFTSYGVTEVVKNGKLQLMTYGTDQQDVQGKAILVKSGSMPAGLSVIGVNMIDAVYGSSAKTALFAAMLAFMAACVIYLIIRYRLCGAAAALTLLGTIGGLIFVFSGMFYSAYGVTVNSFTVFAACVVTFLSLEAATRFSQRISDNLKDNTVQRSIALSFKETLGPTLLTGAITMTVGILLRAFLRTATVGDSVLSPIYKAFAVNGVNTLSLGYAGTVLLFGTMIGFAFSFLGTAAVVYSFGQYGAVNNAAAFGGEKNE